MSAIVIKRQDTGEEVHRIDTTTQSEGQRERAFMGVMRQTDLDTYFVDEEEDES